MTDSSEPRPEEEARIAAEACERGELAHATSHLATALTHDPHHREWRQLLDRVIAASPAPLTLVSFTEGEPIYFGLGAVRAYILASQGEYDDALGLMLDVTNAHPQVPYLDWGRDWLAQPGVVETVSAPRLAAFLASWWKDRQGRDDEVLSLVERARRAFPEASVIAMIASSLLRRAGRFDDALARRTRRMS